MWRFLVWFGAHADALVALLLAVFVTVLDIFDIASTGMTNEAVLLVLALLAFAVLRDRWRRDTTDRELRAALTRTADSMGELPERLDRIARLDELVANMQSALGETSGVRFLTGSEVVDALAEARRHTDRWIFKGGTGTYLRAVTLPECMESARRERRALLVRVEVLDPTHVEVCRRYAQFRLSLSSEPDGTGEPWSTERVRKESYATVLAACWYRQRYQLLDVDIGLSKTMTLFRWDLSSNYLIITQEDRAGLAQMIESGKFYYDSWSTELRNSLEQARRVPVETAVEVPLSDWPTHDETRKLFSKLGLGIPRSFSGEDVDQIIEKALDAKNPYP